jgi:hypothetical protein
LRLFFVVYPKETMSFIRFSLFLLLAINLLSAAIAEDGGGNDDAAADDAAADDAYDQYYENNGVRNWDGYGAGDDIITYWTDYAILPKRCIV